MTHGFYATMGGIAARLYTPVEQDNIRFFVPVQKEDIRDPSHASKGLLFVKESHVHELMSDEPGDQDILSISEDAIKSRSRANEVAKSIACIQAIWFVAQCLTRRKFDFSVSSPTLSTNIYLTPVQVIGHTPISLLELNTFGHALCALLVYALWWEKPFDVESPTIIEIRRIRNAFAHVSMSRCLIKRTECDEGEQAHGKFILPNIAQVSVIFFRI